MTTTIDAKGRVTIPAEVRRALGMREGDTLFLSAEDGVVRLAKAQNPFDPSEPITDENIAERLAGVTNPYDALAMEAEAEFRAGRTRTLREYAKARGLKLDE